ncbi:tryptophan-rich sensory protein [Cumulibacter manganitolerans]|uniref:tryptophan-rich sensory protein n=1 Tax=Cumulibacter manganitolerans TaxID=1884992 RepID=UPI001296C903|nr:tryptophan-rich sensory protein [Cumulibacter manganitolerans]
MSHESTHHGSPDPASSAAAPRGGRTALVTGATGYIGGALIPVLLADGFTVRVLTRDAHRLDGTEWQRQVEVVEGDGGSAADLDRALDGVDVAYYLIHSMGSSEDFVARDRALATAFAAAADRAGVGRIVYLGGIHPHDEELSAHLASRAEVGRILLGSSVPTAVLQAAVILGTGSASFDMLRHLASRLPVMVAPRWLRNRVQPIAIADVVRYLRGAADLPAEVNRTFDIGGPDVLTYREMLVRYARLTGHGRRLIVTVPVLTPRLASRWIGLVTPLNVPLARALIDSLVHEVVCSEDDIRGYVPDPAGGLAGFDEAVGSTLGSTPTDGGPRNLALTSAATVAAAAVGSLATTPGSRWYRSLDLPSWQPPTIAFPVVWTALYADIAATSAVVLTDLERREKASEAAAYKRALWANLALNAGWSVLFWRVRRPWLAALESAVLTASSADLARRAAASSPQRGARLAPYAAWTGFATALSTAIARRNRPAALRGRRSR